MREVDWRYLRNALQSLWSSTDLVLASRKVKAVLSRRCSLYVSHRRMYFDVLERPLGDVLLVANYRKILLVGLSEEAVEHAAETIGRAGRPFEDSQLGWDGPFAEWMCDAVPSTLPMLHGFLCLGRDYGLIGPDWVERPLVYAAWLVPVVMDWDENGRPVFSWPERPTEPESEPVDQNLPVEV